jgi:hypothetical protein
MGVDVALHALLVSGNGNGNGNGNGSSHARPGI